MFKGNRKYIFVLLVCFVALTLLQINAPKPIDWSLSYEKEEKIPFGTKALYDLLPKLFTGQQIVVGDVPLYNNLKSKQYKNCNYVIINNAFAPDSLDVRELLRFVREGNDVFIAANTFSGVFSDTLKIKSSSYTGFGNLNPNDTALFSALYYGRDTVKTNFASPNLKRSFPYEYIKGIEGSYFSSFDTLKTVVLGATQNHKVNFIKINYGNGHLFLNTLPESFTNYHFVSSNCSYVYKALSYLPNHSVIWDEYYKAGNVQTDNPLRVIFNNPLLRKAYYLLMLSLIVFVILGVKRKQRIIPVIEPFPNTTLQFVDIVGTLYYQTGNHKNIADKKITYFLEYIRTAFVTKTTVYDTEFITRISNLSGINQEQVTELFYFFSELNLKQTVSQQELLKLNGLIEKFYKNSKR